MKNKFQFQDFKNCEIADSNQQKSLKGGYISVKKLTGNDFIGSAVDITGPPSIPSAPIVSHSFRTLKPRKGR